MVAPVDDVTELTALLGRPPSTDFVVVVRSNTGDAVVIRNEPLARDGSPRPTRYWLVDRALCISVSRLESTGGVRAAEVDVDPAALQAAHDAYAAERDAAIPVGHVGPRPHGGVGGTGKGVKCLHAHYAAFLVDGTDPVGAWVAARLQPASTDPAMAGLLTPERGDGR